MRLLDRIGEFLNDTFIRGLVALLITVILILIVIYLTSDHNIKDIIINNIKILFKVIGSTLLITLVFLINYYILKKLQELLKI
jgi:hypothetical protein